LPMHRAHFGFRRIGKREARGRRVGRSHSPRAATARRAGPVKGRGTRVAMLPRAGWDRERWAGPGALGPVAEDEAPASRRGWKNIAEAASPDCLTCEEESLCTPSGEALSAAGAATRTSPLGVDPRRSVGSIGTHRAGRRPGAIARPGKTGSSGRDARPCPAVVRAPRKSFRFRAHSVDSGLVLLGARGRGGRCKGYEQLMPLVLQTLVRLRCVLASPRAPSAPARPIEEPRFFPPAPRALFPFFPLAAVRTTIPGDEFLSRRARKNADCGKVTTSPPRAPLAADAPPRPPLARRSDGWGDMDVSRVDAWFREHSHPAAVNGPPPPLGADLAKIGRRLLIGVRSPTKAGSADLEITSCRPGTVDDVIAAAMERARTFTPAQYAAFELALRPERWLRVDRLHDDREVRARAPALPRRKSQSREPVACVRAFLRYPRVADFLSPWARGFRGAPRRDARRARAIDRLTLASSARTSHPPASARAPARRSAREPRRGPRARSR